MLAYDEIQKRRRKQADDLAAAMAGGAEGLMAAIGKLDEVTRRKKKDEADEKDRAADEEDRKAKRDLAASAEARRAKADEAKTTRVDVKSPLDLLREQQLIAAQRKEKEATRSEATATAAASPLADPSLQPKGRRELLLSTSGQGAWSPLAKAGDMDPAAFLAGVDEVTQKRLDAEQKKKDAAAAKEQARADKAAKAAADAEAKAARITERKVEADRAEDKRTTMPVGETKELALEHSTIYDGIDELKELKKNVNTGSLKAKAAAAGLRIFDMPEWAEFRAQAAGIRQFVARVQEGGKISEGDMARYNEFLAGEGFDDAAFDRVLNSTAKMMRGMYRKKIEALGEYYRIPKALAPRDNEQPSVPEKTDDEFLRDVGARPVE